MRDFISLPGTAWKSLLTARQETGFLCRICRMIEEAYLLGKGLNIMKRYQRVLILAGLISGAFTAGVYAQDILQRVDAYLRPDFQVVLDGTPIQLENPVLVYNDSSYLPLKELAQRLGTNIYWKGDTKTIYINSRINPEQRPEEQNITYEALELSNPYSVMMNYLGADYPVLLTYNAKASSSGAYNNGVYYREKDAKRMGIDTSGLAKAKDRLTNETFISEKELQKRWRQAPRQVYGSGYEAYVIADELHSKKLALLRSQIKGMASIKFGDVESYTKPIMVEKDLKKDKEDVYHFLYLETVRVKNSPPQTRYKMAELKLTQDIMNPDSYVVNIANTYDLLMEAEKREQQAKP